MSQSTTKDKAPAGSLYGLFNVAAWVFVWRLPPEPTGHSLEDIEAHLQDGRFRPSDFAGHA